jgi:hypothetical protein
MTRHTITIALEVVGLCIAIGVIARSWREQRLRSVALACLGVMGSTGCAGSVARGAHGWEWALVAICVVGLVLACVIEHDHVKHSHRDRLIPMLGDQDEPAELPPGQVMLERVFESAGRIVVPKHGQIVSPTGAIVPLERAGVPSKLPIVPLSYASAQHEVLVSRLDVLQQRMVALEAAAAVNRDALARLESDARMLYEMADRRVQELTVLHTHMERHGYGRTAAAIVHHLRAVEALRSRLRERYAVPAPDAEAAP